MADLQDAGVPTEHVRPITDLVSVISEYLPENPEALEEFTVFAHSLAGKDRLKEAIDRFFEVEQRIPLIAKPGVLPHWLLEQDIEGLHTVLETKTESARPLEADTFLVTGQIEGLAYIGGVVWVRELFEGPWEVWDSLGEQYYVAHPQPQQVTAHFSARFRVPSELQDLHVDQAILLVDQLAPGPQYAPATPPDADAPLLEQARWLEAEMSRLRRITGREYQWAIRDEGFIQDLSAALATIETAVAEHLTQGQSIPLATDNLGSILEEREGLRAALDALKALIDRLEVEEA